MTDDERKMDEILKKYLPSISTKDLEIARARVLKRLGDEIRYEPDRYGFSRSRALGEFEQRVLAAVRAHGGDADLVNIAANVNEFSPKPMAETAVYLTLNGLEGQGFIASIYREAEQGVSQGKRYFTMTEDGERALAKARAEGKEAADPLGDFA